MKRKSLFAAFILFFGTAFLATPIAFANPAESEEPGEESGLGLGVELGPVELEVGINTPSNPDEDPPVEEPPVEEPPVEEPPVEEPPVEEPPVEEPPVEDPPGGEPPGEEPPGEDPPGEEPGDEPGEEPGDEPGEEPGDEPGDGQDPPGGDPSEEDPAGEQPPVQEPELPESPAQDGSQLPKSGQSGQSDSESDSEGEGGELPKTATPYPLMSLVGSLMMAAGFALMKLRPSRG